MPTKPTKPSLLLAAAVMVACQGDPEHGFAGSHGKGLEKLLVSIPGQEVTEGFAQGRIRREQTVNAFGITRTPITVDQYEECVDAGACIAPKASCSNLDGGDGDEALVCASPAEAERFCKWHGGRLPTLSEWFLAARGPSVHRFSWGDAAATCAMHPMASTQRLADAPAGQDGGEQADDCGDDSKRMLVGQHAAGESPFGIEDVLLAGAELLRGDSDARFAPCRGASVACVVYGLTAGSIDSVERVPMSSASGGDPDAGTVGEFGSTAGFRCVVQEEKR